MSPKTQRDVGGGFCLVWTDGVIVTKNSDDGTLPELSPLMVLKAEKQATLTGMHLCSCRVSSQGCSCFMTVCGIFRQIFFLYFLYQISLAQFKVSELDYVCIL